VDGEGVVLTGKEIGEIDGDEEIGLMSTGLEGGD
jgi:hypothetical protein